MTWIDETKCIGCTVCVGICPDGFEMKGDKAVTIDSNAACINDAMISCPVGAIMPGDATDTGAKTQQEQDISRGGGRGAGKGMGRGLGRGPKDGRGQGRSGRGRGRL